MANYTENGDFRLAQPGQQFDPHGTQLPGGNYARVQIFDASGQAAGADIFISHNPDGSQRLPDEVSAFEPNISSDGHGGFYAVWVGFTSPDPLPGATYFYPSQYRTDIMHF